jgi:hypothetical protein
MRTIPLMMLVSTLMIGCEKKGTEAAGGASVKPKGVITRPALTAEPEPAAFAAADTAPLDSVAFRMTAKRTENGWPKYKAFNLGTKEIAFLAITAYAYDKDSKQIARTSVPLSWNGKIPAGGKTDWDIEILDAAQVPETAASYQLCYFSIKFAGESNSTDDNSRCPEQMPKK